MIKNERQYKITKSQAEKFRQALDDFDNGTETNIHPLLVKAQKDSLMSQYDELYLQIEEYEALKSGQRQVLENIAWEDLPRALIQARIASGLTQKDLADRIGMKEQQIQRYEMQEYATASFDRLKEIIQALDINVQENVYLTGHTDSVSNIFSRLKEIGLDRSFILNRILPKNLVALIEQENNGEISGNLAVQVATSIARVFSWSPTSILTAQPLRLNPAFASVARFKTTTQVEERKFQAYVVYAHLLSLITLEASKSLVAKKIPDDPIEVRENILSNYGEISLENALHYVWDLGIPVLPLKDSGAFHGACWRFGGRNIIVLKQRTSLFARWLFDLLHELYHSGQEIDKDEYSVIEEDPISIEHQVSYEEENANAWAHDVTLAGRAEELTQMCNSEAQGKLPVYKRIVPTIAAREGFNVGDLANYIAYRLAKYDHQDWWGTAHNLQISNGDPWSVAREVFFSRVNIRGLNSNDRDLLLRAMDDQMETEDG